MAQPIPAKKQHTITRSNQLFGLAPWMLLTGIGFIVFIIYQSVFKAQITNWDDQHYLLEQPAILELTWQHVREIFSSKVLGSYNPLVMLSFALDHAFVQFRPAWYHIENVCWHILNTIILFWVIKNLSGSHRVALITAVFFAIHPMHVESVAWIAGRKDVLFTFFFLLSWGWYLNHLADPKKYLWYLLCLLAFALSVLAKPQAVTLPLVLVISQFYIERKWNMKRMMEWIPFFALALFIGFFTLTDIGSQANTYQHHFTFGDRMIYSFLAFGMYVFKCVLPFDLATLYAFPDDTSFEFITGITWSIVLISSCVLVSIKYARRYPWILFGILFFALNVLLLLHFVAANSSLIYERFTYVSYIGLFFVVAVYIDQLKANKRNYGFVITGIVALLFTYLTSEKAKAWINSETLWTDVIEHNSNSEVAYNNRGSYYIDHQKYELALPDLNQSIRINPNDPGAYTNLCIINNHLNQWEEALVHAKKTIALDSGFYLGWFNLGITYHGLFLKHPSQKDFADSSILAYNKALILVPSFTDALINRGNMYAEMGAYPKAMADLKTAAADPLKKETALLNLVHLFIKMDRLDEAEKYVSELNGLNAFSDASIVLSNAYNDKGIELAKRNQLDEAGTFYDKAIQYNIKNVSACFNLGAYYYFKGDTAQARRWWQGAVQIQPDYAPALDQLKALDKIK